MSFAISFSFSSFQLFSLSVCRSVFLAPSFSVHFSLQVLLSEFSPSVLLIQSFFSVFLFRLAVLGLSRPVFDSFSFIVSLRVVLLRSPVLSFFFQPFSCSLRALICFSNVTLHYFASFRVVQRNPLGVGGSGRRPLESADPPGSGVRGARGIRSSYYF